MQFTGLKDKNGKEVYEGDIVKSDLPINPGGVVKYVIYKARFVVEEKTFIVDIESINKSNNLLQTKVIGNIYENPELLN